MVYNPFFDVLCTYCILVFINFSTIASWLSSIASNCPLWVLQKEYISKLHTKWSSYNSQCILISSLTMAEAKNGTYEEKHLRLLWSMLKNQQTAVNMRKHEVLKTLTVWIKSNTPSHQNKLKQNWSHYRVGISFFPSQRSKVLRDLICLEDLLHQHFNEFRSWGLIAALAKA